ncbi:MAG: 3-oxoacyl-ACP synthase [Desmonostoc geniculatum HA4340-LM1]|jgi:alkylresorcinol/alkylpyrone synthase|nr:3-oxoacyl-ACP synthase [Desmonostoc geniculatum HA4340-LM1]
MTYIIDTATGFPEHYYPQEVLEANIRNHCAAILSEYCEKEGIDFEAQTFLDLDQIHRFFSNVKIGGRYFTLPLDDFDPDNPPGIGEAFNTMVEKTMDIVETTVTKLLHKADISPKAISHITSVSVLPAVPSLEGLLMNRIDFPFFAKRMALSGVGCLGGAQGLARVADYLEGHPTEAAILFTTDPSSGLWQGSIHGDLAEILNQLPNDPAQYSNVIMTLVVAALFGDGVGAVLMAGREHPLVKQGKGKLKIIDSRSILLPQTSHLMALPLTDYGFRQILRPEVSDYVKGGVRKAVESLLNDRNLTIDQISRWMVHPGGPKILDAVQEEFELDAEALQVSWDVLGKIGNIASATVLCILDETLSRQQPPSGSYGLLVAMGPGFSQEVILVQW